MEFLGHLNKAVGEGSWRPTKASRNYQGISHIFFADDLFLFGEASIEQARAIAKVMEVFCIASGQKVNIQKSKLFASKNVASGQTDRLSHTFEIPCTADLGIYLGMLVLHRRLITSIFDFLTAKVHKRLSG